MDVPCLSFKILFIYVVMKKNLIDFTQLACGCPDWAGSNDFTGRTLVPPALDTSYGWVGKVRSCCVCGVVCGNQL